MYQDLPEDKRKKLPRYPLVPAILLGRLALDERYQKQGLGAFLLADALYRSLLSEIAAVAIVVDAKNEQAQAFYEYHQFLPFPKYPARLYLPMAIVAQRFK
jgi:GNAT superfamily N-acetyltransferase